MKSPYKYLSQMLEVIILTRMCRGVYCRTGSIHAQLSGGVRAALIFVLALDYHLSLCALMSLTFGRHAFQIVVMTSCLKM